MGVVVALESPPGEAAVVGASSPPAGVAGAFAGAVSGAVAGATSAPAGVVGTELKSNDVDARRCRTALVDSAASSDIV